MSDIVPIAAPLPLPSAMYPLGMVSLAAPGSEALLLLAPETLEVVDRLRAPAPVLRQAWSADGMALALTHAARRGTALSMVDFRRGLVHGPVEAPAQLESDAALVALENGVALADRAGRRVLLVTLRGSETRMRAIRLPLEPHLLARSHDGAWLAVGGGPGEGILILDPQSGQTVATWGDGGEAEGALAVLVPGPTPGDWLAGEAATGAVLLVTPGSPRPVRARWPAPAPSERGRQPRVTALLSAPGSALVWATYGAPGSPVGMAIYDIAAGRQVAWRRRIGLATPLDLRSLALDPAGRCLYALRTPNPGDDDSPGGEALALTPLLTRVGARLALDGDRAGAALAVRPATSAAG